MESNEEKKKEEWKIWKIKTDTVKRKNEELKNLKKQFMIQKDNNLDNGKGKDGCIGWRLNV